MSVNVNVPEIDKSGKQPLPWSLWLRQIRAIFRLEIEKNFLGRRSILLYLLALIPIVPLALLAPFTPPGREWQDFTQYNMIFAIYYGGLILRTVVFFGCAWIFMNLFRGDIVDRSLHFYFLSPVRREVLVVGKYFSGLVTSIILFTGSNAFVAGNPLTGVITDGQSITGRIDVFALGDFNRSGQIDSADIDLLCDAIQGAGGDEYDVNGDNAVTTADVQYHLESIIGSNLGDTDVDGDVDLSDLGNLATNYEQAPPRSWGQGDFDCDEDVDLSDLGTLATFYGNGQAQAYAEFSALTGVEVPEPASAVGLGLCGLLMLRRRGGN